MDASALDSAESWLAIIWWVKLTAAGLVALGVAMEFGSDWIARPFEKTVKEARDTELKEMAKETANAKAAAETAKAEQERLKSLVVWRSITDQQIAKLASILSAKKETILLAVVANDPEAMFFANLLTVAFKKAEWVAVARSVSWGNWLPIGVHIYGQDGDALKALIAAFTATGVPIDLKPPPRDPDVSIVFEQDKNPSVTVLVGSKIGPL